ncbi:MAG: hypothetical protein JW384_02659 [Nitrosomonadaceae bacterium]|nr:hypothetical protein [Nitrosomonadaceae bacterium]
MLAGFVPDHPDPPCSGGGITVGGTTTSSIGSFSLLNLYASSALQFLKA